MEESPAVARDLITNDARCQQTHNLVFLIHQHISFREALEMAFNLQSIE